MAYQSKLKEIDALNQKIDKYRPFDRRILKQIKEYFRIGLTYSSNALEGNTLTETETKVVLEDGLTIAGKPLKDHYEASGHSDSYDFVYSLAKKKTISEQDILTIHKLFYQRIDSRSAGKYRKVGVVITGTDYIPPSAASIPTLMKEFVREINSSCKKLHPVDAAALIHQGLVDIHPFIDGNGRTARLLMNLLLLQSGYVVTIIPPILRADYISLIKKSQTGRRDATQFRNFISEMVYESTKDYHRLVKALKA